MEEIKICGGFKLENPQLRLMKEKMVDLLIRSVYQRLQSKESLPKDKKDFTIALLKYVSKKYQETKPELFNNDMLKILPYELNQNNKLTSEINIESEMPVLDQIDTLEEFGFMRELNSNKKIRNLFQSLNWISFDTSSNNEGENSNPTCTINSIDFRIDKVKCVRKIGEASKEEIEIGGIAIDSNGNESKINARDVAGKNFFNAGKIKDLQPDWIFKKFINIGSDFSESKIFIVTPFMSERDGQGFADFLDEAYKSIEDEIEKIFKQLGETAGGIIGAKIGGATGTAVAGPIGAALGALAGLILGELVSFFIDVFKDDIFVGTDDHIALLSIDNPCFRFNGSATSPEQKMIFNKDDGEYEMTYYWNVNGSIS